MKWTSWLALAALLAVGGFVIYAGFHAGAVRCDVCMEFRGRTACRAVEGATEQEARAGATTNACALLASGVTETMACQRAEPVSSTCRRP